MYSQNPLTSPAQMILQTDKFETWCAKIQQFDSLIPGASQSTRNVKSNQTGSKMQIIMREPVKQDQQTTETALALVAPDRQRKEDSSYTAKRRRHSQATPIEKRVFLLNQIALEEHEQDQQFQESRLLSLSSQPESAISNATQERVFKVSSAPSHDCALSLQAGVQAKQSQRFTEGPDGSNCWKTNFFKVKHRSKVTDPKEAASETRPKSHANFTLLQRKKPQAAPQPKRLISNSTLLSHRQAGSTLDSKLNCQFFDKDKQLKQIVKFLVPQSKQRNMRGRHGILSGNNMQETEGSLPTKNSFDVAADLHSFETRCSKMPKSMTSTAAIFQASQPREISVQLKQSQTQSRNLSKQQASYLNWYKRVSCQHSGNASALGLPSKQTAQETVTLDIAQNQRFGTLDRKVFLDTLSSNGNNSPSPNRDLERVNEEGEPTELTTVNQYMMLEQQRKELDESGEDQSTQQFYELGPFYSLHQINKARRDSHPTQKQESSSPFQTTERQASQLNENTAANQGAKTKASLPSPQKWTLSPCEPQKQPPTSHHPAKNTNNPQQKNSAQPPLLQFKPNYQYNEMNEMMLMIQQQDNQQAVQPVQGTLKLKSPRTTLSQPTIGLRKNTLKVKTPPLMVPSTAVPSNQPIPINVVMQYKANADLKESLARRKGSHDVSRQVVRNTMFSIDARVQAQIGTTQLSQTAQMNPRLRKLKPTFYPTSGKLYQPVSVLIP